MGDKQTLREELEILRGESIQTSTGDPNDIPCIETSDPERLCKHPVVSVNMVTYNHEPYIRQAIEGVMMQQTDFEFELVIGEDCSTDKTREICFEYQRHYPDKIRILWCAHNLYRNPHPAGGNYERNVTRCRGEYMALCEGDDYWIDPLKLQKQVDVMRKHSNVGLCFCGGKHHDQSDGREWPWDADGKLPPGLISGQDFLCAHIFGRDPANPGPEIFLMTASTLLRKSIFIDANERFDIFKWRLRLGDSTLWLGIAAQSDCYYLPDEVCVYRRTTAGACVSSNGGVWFDAFIVRMYYAELLELPYRFAWMRSKALDPFRHMVLERLMKLAENDAKTTFKSICRSKKFPIFSSLRLLPLRIIIAIFGVTMKSKIAFGRFYKYTNI